MFRQTAILYEVGYSNVKDKNGKNRYELTDIEKKLGRDTGRVYIYRNFYGVTKNVDDDYRTTTGYFFRRHLLEWVLYYVLGSIYIDGGIAGQMPAYKRSKTIYPIPNEKNTTVTKNLINNDFYPEDILRFEKYKHTVDPKDVSYYCEYMETDEKTGKKKRVFKNCTNDEATKNKIKGRAYHERVKKRTWNLELSFHDLLKFNLTDTLILKTAWRDDWREDPNIKMTLNSQFGYLNNLIFSTGGNMNIGNLDIPILGGNIPVNMNGVVQLMNLKRDDGTYVDCWNMKAAQQSTIGTDKTIGQIFDDISSYCLNTYELMPIPWCERDNANSNFAYKKDYAGYPSSNGAVILKGQNKFSKPGVKQYIQWNSNAAKNFDYSNQAWLKPQTA